MWGMKNSSFNPKDKELVLVSLNPKLVATENPQEIDYLELCRFNLEEQTYYGISGEIWLGKNEITWWIPVDSIFENQNKITDFIMKKLDECEKERNKQ